MVKSLQPSTSRGQGGTQWATPPEATEERRQEYPHSHTATFLPACLALWPLLNCLPPCPMYPLPFSMSAEGSNCVCPSLQHLASPRASANCQRNERTQAFLLWKTSQPYQNPPQYLSLPLQMPYPGPWHDLATSSYTSLIPTILLHSLDSGHTSLITAPHHAAPTPASASACTSACVLRPSLGWFHPAHTAPHPTVELYQPAQGLSTPDPIPRRIWAACKQNLVYLGHC